MKASDLTTLSKLITENTEIIEIKVHQNRPQRPDIRGNHSGTWNRNNHIFKNPLHCNGFLFYRQHSGNTFVINFEIPWVLF